MKGAFDFFFAWTSLLGKRRRMIYLWLIALGGGLGLWAYKAMIDVRPDVKRPSPDKEAHAVIKDLEERIKGHVTTLADDIGPRNVYIRGKLTAAADYIRGYWETVGYEVKAQSFKAENVLCENLIVEIPGKSKPDEIIVVGAHYDTVSGSPGANDNGSAVAALLELSRLFKEKSLQKTTRFVAFSNEEPPFFKTKAMGSLVYAKACQSKKENIVAMVCLETIGYYREERKTQKYPVPLSFFYPDRGDFLAVVGNLRSKPLVQLFTRHFMEQSDFPVECAAITDLIPLSGIDWSDHWSFWKCGFPAIMLTDTALFRYPYYHSSEDTADKLDYPNLARATHAILKTLMRML